MRKPASILLLGLASDALGKQHVPGVVVDLGYAKYTSVYNRTTGLDVWKGIRYARPPVGNLRWQAPQVPAAFNASPASALADHFGPRCSQSFPQVPGLSSLPPTGDEDCLFLNVYSPSSRSSSERLPVLIWIHGGGYGQGDAAQDMSGLLMANNNNIVAVSIQYRLGAFGFLSSAEVKRQGLLNAGLADQRLAMVWVKKHISKFGGDEFRVTIAGESAGAGSVLLHSLASSDSDDLFQNIFAASPWIPTQPRYDDRISERHYADFASAAGCHKQTASTSLFDCLVEKDSGVLQNASNWVSTNPPTAHSNWAFIPVTDDTYLMGPPSQLFTSGQPVRGTNALIGNNADEGVLIPPGDIQTEDDIISWMRSYFLGLSDADIDSVMDMYQINGSFLQKYETDGRHPPTANEVSSVAVGEQQRTYNIYAEASVICPSYWLGNAFSTQNKRAFHYQYSVPFAAHGLDLAAYWGPPGLNLGPGFVQAFREIIGRFVAFGDPSPLPGFRGTTEQQHSAEDWPTWQDCSGLSHKLVNLNQTGGTPFKVTSPTGVGTVTLYGPPGQQNSFSVEDADAWERGRGKRCKFWQRPKVPQ